MDKVFKKTGDRLAYNTANSKPVFKILQTLTEGYVYIVEGRPFGPMNFVLKDAVVEEVEDESSKSTK